MRHCLDAFKRWRDLLNDLRQVLEDKAAGKSGLFVPQLYHVVAHTSAYIHDGNVIIVARHTLFDTLFYGEEARIHPAWSPLVITSHVVVEGFLNVWSFFPPHWRPERGIMAVLERTRGVI